MTLDGCYRELDIFLANVILGAIQKGLRVGVIVYNQREREREGAPRDE